MSTSVKRLSDYFNCDDNPISQAIYAGRHMGFFAVVDDLNDGRTFAAGIPFPQCRGMDVFEGKPVPPSVVFLYPEHSLVPKQQHAFVDQLIKHYPDVKHIIIITTSATILSDAIACERLRSEGREEETE